MIGFKMHETTKNRRTELIHTIFF